jgi:hypothetical protein
LQGARAATLAESTSRATMSLGSVSAGLVALGMIATATRLARKIHPEGSAGLLGWLSPQDDPEFQGAGITVAGWRAPGGRGSTIPVGFFPWVAGTLCRWSGACGRAVIPAQGVAMASAQGQVAGILS